jgi:hypothetical protein
MRYLMLLMVLCLSANGYAEPRSKPVDLHKRTNLIVYVLPDLGVRFTYPFILDEQDAYVPFTLNITNPLFEAKREAGRNYFVITGKQGSPANMLGNIFMTVAGFEITVELRTTNDLTKHYSDIEFKLTDEDRENLIQQGIAQRTKSLETEYTKKFAEIETVSDQKAVARVGRLALTKPSRKGIKEETYLKLSNGDKVVLFVDEAVNYEPYTIFVFDITNNSSTQGIGIMDAKIFAVNKDTKQERPLNVGKDLPGRVQPSERIQAALTVLDSNLNPKEYLKLQVLTDKGSMEAQW